MNTAEQAQPQHHGAECAEEMADKKAELERCLKENESQRTEIDGYINQLNIQLHRWQLRLQTLNDRNRTLKSELRSLLPGND